MPDQNLLPPRYVGAQLIARGGMGEVYRATDTALDREVAVKVLSDWYAADEEVRARFTREALAAARLSSEPNTVTIFDVGESQGRPFIVMAHLAGGSLAERVHGGPVDARGRSTGWSRPPGRSTRHTGTVSSTVTSSLPTSSSTGTRRCSWPTSGSRARPGSTR